MTPLRALLVAAAAVLVWVRGVGGDLCADDFTYVSFGRALAQLPLLESLQFYWIELPEEMGLRFYRPSIGWSYSLEHRLFGLDATPRRVVNLALHATSSVLLTSLVWNATRAAVPALAAGLLFAVGPAHAESTQWISSRVNLLATVGVLTALVAFGRRHSGGVRLWTAVGWIGAFVGMTAKETGAVTAPLLTWLVLCGVGCGHELGAQVRAASSWRERVRIAAVTTWPYWLGFGLYVALRAHALGTFGTSGYVTSFDLGSAAHWATRAELLFALIAPVHRGLWSVPVVLVTVFVVVHAIALTRAARGASAGGMVAWGGTLALTLLPTVFAPFQLDALLGARSLYEPSAVLAVGVAMAFRGNASHATTLRAVGLAALVGFYAVVAWGNADAWVRVGAVSRALHDQLRAWDAADDAPPRTIVDLPERVDGAYLFLTSPPLVHPSLGIAFHARVAGLRDRDWPALLRQAAHVSRGSAAIGGDNVLRDREVWQVSTVDGALHRVDPADWLVASAPFRDAPEVARIARFDVLGGESIPVQLRANEAVRGDEGFGARVDALELRSGEQRWSCALVRRERVGPAAQLWFVPPAGIGRGTYATTLCGIDGERLDVGSIVLR